MNLTEDEILIAAQRIKLRRKTDDIIKSLQEQELATAQIGTIRFAGEDAEFLREEMIKRKQHLSRSINNDNFHRYGIGEFEE